MTILVIGGAGYIGSDTVLELLEAGQKVVVNKICNASLESLTRVAQMTGRECIFYQRDILDKVFLDSVFA